MPELKSKKSGKTWRDAQSFYNDYIQADPSAKNHSPDDLWEAARTSGGYDFADDTPQPVATQPPPTATPSKPFSFSNMLYNLPGSFMKQGKEMLVAYTPFIDFLYRINRKTSINTEIQYMMTKQDYGNWLNLFFEFDKSPHWSLEASAMYNIVPSDRAPKDQEGKFKKIIYPSVGATYSRGSNRFSLRYIKQVEGVVCSGGVCRLEPAFSGVKFNVTSRF